MVHARSARWPAGCALVLSCLASGCFYSFDRDYDPRDGGGVAEVDARPFDAAFDAPVSAPDAHDACAGVAEGGACPGGVCTAGVCCTGCVGAGGCEIGDSTDQCGAGGSVCRRCSSETPVCGAGRCLVEHAMVQISLGAEHRCARDAAGRVYCWGNDDSGQLGFRPADGTCDVATPTEVPLGMPALHVSASGRGTCALLADQSVRCWGLGLAGAGSVSAETSCLESAVATARRTPAAIDPVVVIPSELPLAWRAIASADRVRFGLNGAGLAFYWGDYDYDERPPPDQPVRVLGPEIEFTELVAHDQLALARTADERVFTFGRSAQELTMTPLASDVVAMSAGVAHWCVAHRDGRLECRGPYLPATWEDGPTGGRLVPRTDTAPITSIAVSYLAAPVVVCWTNADEELWCSSRPEGPLTLVTESRFQYVTVGIYTYGALDTAGRMWTFHIGDPGRPSVTMLPP